MVCCFLDWRGWLFAAGSLAYEFISVEWLVAAMVRLLGTNFFLVVRVSSRTNLFVMLKARHGQQANIT